MIKTGVKMVLGVHSFFDAHRIASIGGQQTLLHFTGDRIIAPKDAYFQSLHV